MKDLRLAALRRFAMAISILTLLGHTFFGFEQSYATVVVALVTAYAAELGLEVLDAYVCARTVGFRGGITRFIDFLLPAHITALACAMLLYPNERLGPMMFAAAVGIASKAILRAPINGSVRHFLNPSNTGIAVTLLVFPWVGVAMPYQFTENLFGVADWILPGIFVCVGTFLNGRFTKRLPLIAGWLSGFILQATLRSIAFGTPLAAALGPMTGVAFVLFTFYMVPDPGTTPTRPRDQVCFGTAVAGTYGFLQLIHVVYGLFFALALVCTARGCLLWFRESVRVRRMREDARSHVGSLAASFASTREAGT
jgi:enediyne biosynthesis protein E5